MKEYVVEYTTDFCDDFPERIGHYFIKANSVDEAEKKFSELKIFKSVISNVYERN